MMEAGLPRAGELLQTVGIDHRPGRNMELDERQQGMALKSGMTCI